MSGIQGTGSQPVGFDTSSAAVDSEGTKIVSSGLIGNDTKLQMMHAQKAITHSQLAHRPTLLKPKDMGMKAQALANQAASHDLAGLSDMTKSASLNVANAMVRAQLGMQTPEDQVMFQRNASTLSNSANYIDSLFKGKGELTDNEKANILGGQGFNDEQIEDLLLSQKDKHAFKAKVQQKYGETYQQNLSDMKNMGYDEEQANLFFALTDKDIIKNDNRKAELSSLFKGNEQAQKLIKMGFNEQQIKALLVDHKRVNQQQDKIQTHDNKLLKLNEKLGFNEKEAKLLQVSGNGKKQIELSSLLKRDPNSIESLTNKLRAVSISAQTMANSPLKPFLEEHLKQQADIFMVLELIHEMSVKQRRFARESRQLEYEAAMQETLKQAEHIRKAAKMQLAADCVQGGMSIGGGMMSMGAGLKGSGSKKTTGGKKGTDMSVDDVQISKGGGKRGASGSNDVNEASTANRKDAKKQRSKQTVEDDAAEQMQSKRQDAAKQKQQEGIADETQNARERRSDSQAESQRIDTAAQHKKKSDIELEDLGNDNDIQAQRTKNVESDSQEVSNNPLQASRKKTAKRGGMSRWSPGEIDALGRGENLRTGRQGKAVRGSMVDQLKAAGAKNNEGISSSDNANQQQSIRSGKKASNKAVNTDPATIRQDTSLIRGKASAKKQALSDTEDNLHKAQKQRDKNDLETQELDSQNVAQKKKQVTKDQDKEVHAAKEYQNDSQANSQRAETDLNNQKKKQDTVEQKVAQDKDSAKSKASKQADSDEMESLQEQKNQEKQMKLNNLQGQSATINAVFGGLGSVAGAGFRFFATEEQALQKESEARQKVHENAAQSWSEWMQLHQDQIKNCQSKIDEISRIHFDTLKSLSRS